MKTWRMVAAAAAMMGLAPAAGAITLMPGVEGKDTMILHGWDLWIVGWSAPLRVDRIRRRF